MGRLSLGEKAVSVVFPSGRDVLNSYWGFLSNGGLVLRESHGLCEGDEVHLDVTIESVQQHYHLRGKVVRRPVNTPTADHAVVAFAPGEPQDLLLSAAWADTDKVPPRRHRRFNAKAEIRFIWPRLAQGSSEPATHVLDGSLINVSRGGCCVRVRTSAPHNVSAGDRVSVQLDGLEVGGLVRWARSVDFGLEFESGDARVDDMLQKFLQR